MWLQVFLMLFGCYTLAQENSDQYLSNYEIVHEKLMNIDVHANDLFLRASNPNVPGVDGSLPTSEEFKELDTKFTEIIPEIESILSKSESELLYGENHEEFITQKFLSIIETYVVALNILSAKIHAGFNLNELNLDGYNLKIPTDIFAEMSGHVVINFIRDESSDFIVEKNDKNIILKINPFSLIKDKMVVDTSKNTDESLSKLIRWPIIQLYFYSILDIRRLRLGSIRGTEVPNLELLDETDPVLSQMLLDVWNKTIEKEKEDIFRRAIYNNLIELMFKRDIANVRESAKDTNLTLNEFIDNNINDEWTNLVIADETYLNAFNNLNVSKLEEYGVTETTLQIAEFAEDFDNSLYLLATGWAYALNCESLDSCIDNDYLKLALADILSSAKHNAHYSKLQVPSLTDEETNTIFGALDRILEDRKLQLKDEFYRSPLLTSWIEKIVESVQSSDGQINLQQQGLLAFAEELKSSSKSIYNLSWLLDYDIQVRPLYNTILFQKDLTIDPYTDLFMRSIVDEADSYNSARASFYKILQNFAVEISGGDDIFKSEKEEQIDFIKINNILDNAKLTDNDHLFEQNTKARSIKIFEELIGFGRNMGFYSSEPTIRAILSDLPKPDTGGLPILNYIKNFFSKQDSSLWYQNRYQQFYKNEVLNESRLLGQKFSPEKNKNIYEIIAQMCKEDPENPEDKVWRTLDTCRGDVTNLVSNALLAQESQLQESLNNILQKDEVEDVLRIVSSSNIQNVLRTEFEDQLDFHLSSLNEYIDDGNSPDMFTEVSDNLMGTTNSMFLIWALHLTRGVLSRVPVVNFLSPWIASTWASTGRVVQGHFLAMFPIFIAHSGFSIGNFYKKIRPDHEVTEELFYATTSSNEMVDLIQLEFNENEYKLAKTQAQMSAVVAGIIPLLFMRSIIRSLTGIKIFEPVIKRTSKVIFISRERKIIKALQSLRVDPNAFDWNITGLKNIYPSPTAMQANAIRTIEKFHNTYRRSFINNIKALGPIKERYGINPLETNPHTVKMQIKGLKQGASAKQSFELTSLERSMTNRNILLRNRAKYSSLMRRLIYKLENMKLDFVGSHRGDWFRGQIIEVGTR